MKKLYSILLILLLAATAFAQTVAIGTGTSSSSLYGPGYVTTSATNRFSATATLLTAAEIQTANGGVHFNNTIERLDWYIGSGSGYTAGDGVLDIWLVTTARADLSVNENWGAYQTGATQVYSSTTQNFNTAAGYQSFEFNVNTFSYNSETDGNLLIMTQFSRPGAGPATLNWRYTSTSPTYNQRYYTSTVAILSTTAMTRTTSRGNIRVYAPVPYAVGVTPVTVNQTVGYGSSAWYQITVTNTGTQEDTYNLTTSGSTWVDGIYDAVDGSPTTSTGALALNASYNAYVKVTVPGSATVGGTDIFTFTATSPNATASGTRTTTASAGFTVTAVTANQSIGLGKSGWYQVNITNTGTINEAYNLSVAGNVWTTEIYNAIDGAVITNTGTVAPAGVFSAYAKVTVPSSAATLGLTDAFTLTAQSPYTSVTSASRTTTASYGFVATSLQAGSGVNYSWIDNTAPGNEIVYTPLLSGTADDGLFSYTLGEAFNYFGTNYTAGSTVGIGTNGHLVFASTASPMTYTTVLAGINVWGADQNRVSPSQIFASYDAVNHQTVITWYSYKHYSTSTTALATYQLILYHSNGAMKLQYNNFTDATYATSTQGTRPSGPRVGLVKGATASVTALLIVPNATATIDAAFGGGTINNGVAVIISSTIPDPWNYSPANGTVNLDPAVTTFGWEAPGQSTFDVYYGLTTPPSLVATSQTGFTYTPALTAGNTYYWQIVHHFPSRPDYTSSILSFATAAADAPSGPITGSTSNVGASSFDAGWVDNSTNEDYFNVYVAEGSFTEPFDPATAPYAVQVPSTSVATTGTAYTQTVTGLNPNVTYAVRVYAANDNTVMKSGGKGKTGVIRSEWVETEAAAPVYEAVIRISKDGKEVAEATPVVMKAGKGYWRNLSDDNNGKTMGVDEIFYSTSFASTNFTTLAATPEAPTLSNPWVTHMYVAVNNNGTTPNPVATQYAIHETTTNQYVQTTGALGATAAWQTITQWGTKQVTGLSTGTSYTMEVKARNSASMESGFGATATLATVSPPATLFPISYTGPAVAIVDNAPASPAILTINVPSAFVTNYLTVTLSLTHTYVGDLQIRLRAPDLTEVEMFHQHGGTGENMSDLVFDDAAATSITTITTTGPYTGSYRPYASLQTMSGKAALGDWSLVVTDHAGSDVGSVTAFTINFDHFINNQQNANGEGSQEPFAPTFPADPSTGGQPPLVINFPAQNGANTNPGSVTATVYDERPAGVSNTELPPANTINRFWDIQTSTTNFQNAELRLRFTSADLPAGITDPMTATPPLVSAYSNDGGTTWQTWGGVIFDLGGGVYEMVITGLTHFSLWSLGNSGVLPVELSAFSAAASDRAVVLNWRTESETNNDFFRVYRSESSTERGELVGVVDGLGNNQTTHSYRFIDSRVQNGVTYYYRIADVDLNGIEALHPIVVNATPTAGANGIVPTEYVLEQNMPNPFNPTTEIRYSVKEAGLVTLKVFDISGREVATLVNGNHPANNYRVSFDATKLSAGVYFYQIRVNDFYAVRKMVVAK